MNNCRKLILEGWRALIEADPEKTKTLVQQHSLKPVVNLGLIQPYQRYHNA